LLFLHFLHFNMNQHFFVFFRRRSLMPLTKGGARSFLLNNLQEYGGSFFAIVRRMFGYFAYFKWQVERQNKASGRGNDGAVRWEMPSFSGFK
jgi:hypothetical protein